MKYLLLSLLVLWTWGCKEKNKYEKPRWVERWDSVMNEARPLFDEIDTIPFSGETYTFEGKYEQPVGKIQHTIPIKFSGSGGEVLMKKGKKMKLLPIGDSGGQSGDIVGELLTVTDDTSDLLLTVDTSSNYEAIIGYYGNIDSIDFREYDRFSITDSTGEVAYWEKGKWEIVDCQRALEVVRKTTQYLNNPNKKQK